jgi:hypothetical protein
MHDIQTLVETCNAILLEEIEAYEGLLGIQQAEKQLLGARQLDAFLENLHAKEQALHTIAHLEERRQAAVNALGPLLDVDTAPSTLQELSARVPEPQASTMRQYRMRLQRLLGDVQRSSGENACLIQDSLTLIEDALRFFASVLPATPTYQSSGTFPPTTRGRLVSGTV